MYKSQVSSNLLFHFTKEENTLISILKNGFYPMTAIEDISFMMPNYSQMRVGIPMVCFTDIPIELTEEHQKRYGEFGLGLKKDWGIKKGINPIGYMLKGSNAQIAFNNMQKIAQKNALKLDNGNSHGNRTVEMINAVMNYAGFLKIYNDDETLNSKPYYDEKEWRYLPPFMDVGMPSEGYCNRLMPDDVDKEDERKKLNNHMIKKYTLKFEINDIATIILPKSHDVNKFITNLQDSNLSYNIEEYIKKIERNHKQ